MLKYINSLIYPTGKYNVKYTKYITYSFLTNFVISAESVLSTHSMLSAIGSSNTTTILTTNFIGKDIIGNIGGLLFMNKISKIVDNDTKKCLIYVNIFQQIGIILECITPIVNSIFFIPLAGLANITRNLSYTGYGAMNAKCIEKLSEGNNIGEVYAKVTILNTIGSTLGMLSGLTIITLIPDHITRLILLPPISILRFYLMKKIIYGIII
jgi:hypothetical protein